MVLTRTQTGDNSSSGDDMGIEDLKENLLRLQQRAEAGEKENEVLRLQLQQLSEDNRVLREQTQSVLASQASKDIQSSGSQTTVTVTPENSVRGINLIDQTDNALQSGAPVQSQNYVQGDSEVQRNAVNPSAGNVERSANVNTTLVEGILGHFENLQVLVPLPTYDGVRNNAVEFIEKLKRYFIRKKIREDQKLLLAEDALKDRARIWFEARVHPFIDFDHFCSVFLNEFHSVEARTRAKSEWASRKFRNQDRSLYEYFVDQVRAAKYFTPRLDPYEVNYTIAKQLPRHARDILAVVNFAETDRVAQALAHLDESYRESGNEKVANQRERGPASDNAIDESRGFSRQQQRPENKRQNESRGNVHDNWRARTGEAQISGYGKPRLQTNNNLPTGEHSAMQSREERGEAKNLRVISTLPNSEFVRDLCWDVEKGDPEQNDRDLENHSRLISPRLLIKIQDKVIPMLVDSGSDVTCLSERVYSELKDKGKLAELPVSSVNIFVATGRKSITIRKQVQVTILVDKQEITHAYLVVPGLKADVIVGTDWLKSNKVVIDFESEAISIHGKKLPNELVCFRLNEIASEDATLCQALCAEIEKFDASDDGKASHIQDCNIRVIGREVENCVDAQIEASLIKVTGLNERQISQVRELLHTHRTLFSNKPGLTRLYEHVITPIMQKPFVKRSYPVPLKHRAAVEKEIEDMMKLGIIERSSSEFCNPLRVVVKKDKSIRLCLDARFLNKVIAADNESPPCIEEIMQKYEGVKYLSTTDLVKGYWQVPLTSESRKFTAFIFDGKLYQFKVIPFGLKTAGAGFMRVLDLALGNELREFVTNYVDDILVASRSFDEHLDHLGELFQRLEQYGFTLSLEKSQFFRETVPFLGFILSSKGIRADPEKLRAIEEFPIPQNRQQLQAFLGVCGYYRRFSVRHADYIIPFRDLLSSSNAWGWTQEHNHAFNELKKNFVKAVVLSHYLPNARFKLQTDASEGGINGILYQFDLEENPRIVSLVSRVLSKHEKNYSTTERELLAIVYSVLKFRYYLVGAEFDIITDHKSLTFLLTSPFNNARLTRWILCLQEYAFRIEYCKGKDNLVADFFSRHGLGHNDTASPDYLIWRCCSSSPDEGEQSSQSINMIMALSMKHELVNELKDIHSRQKEDDTLKALMKKQSPNLTFLEEKEVVFVRIGQTDVWKLYLPRKMVKNALQCTHDQLGHAGAHKMQHYMSQFFFWRHMRRDIKAFTRACDLCQRVKYLNLKMEGEYQFLKATQPNQMISVDFYGPLPVSVGGAQYIFVIQDVFSKLVTLYPIRRATTQICLSKLTKFYFEKIGKPEKLLSDHGTQFTSPTWQSKLEAIGVTALFSSIRHPQSNPVERTMRELGRIFRTYCADRHTKWARLVPFVQDCINMMVHQSTGFTPDFLHFGTTLKEKILKLFPLLEKDPPERNLVVQCANERLQRAFEQRCRGQKTRSRVNLQLGDLVLLRVPHLSNARQKVISKFFHLYEGPFRIVRVVGENAFELVHPDNPDCVKGVYNRLNLRKYYEPL